MKKVKKRSILLWGGLTPYILNNFRPWLAASIRVVVQQIIRKKAKCFIIFTGGKMNRSPSKKDRLLAEEYGIELIKTNNFFILSCLDVFFNKIGINEGYFFKDLFGGGTLYGTSSRPQKNNLAAIFSLPYHCATPLWVFENQTVYNRQRVALLQTHNNNSLEKTTILFGGLNVLFLIINLQRFIYIKLLQHLGV